MSTGEQARAEAAAAAPPRNFSAAETGAITHLYRAEICRSTPEPDRGGVD